MSSLIVNAYLRDGHGARIYSSYSKRLLILAAVMYVDNTDLVHWSNVPSCTPTELIAAAQTATYAWGGLAIATGAVMKPEKCYVYFLSYWYNHGREKLRNVKALPDSILNCPHYTPSRRDNPITFAGSPTQQYFSSNPNITK